jgi:reactive intermediate/imine deaminase
LKKTATPDVGIKASALPRYWAAVDEVYTTFFQNGVPARTTLAVSALPMDALVQMEALVSNGEGTIPSAPQAGDLIKVTKNTSKAPLSPLSAQSVAFSHYNHLSAQLPLDPKTGKMVAGGVKEQAEQCLKNIKAIVESIDHAMDDVVKVTVLLKNSADMAAVDEVYTTFFPSGIPARTTFAVSALPMDALVQIDAVVSNAEGTPPIA